MGYRRGDDVLNRVMRLFMRPVRFPRDGVVLMLTGFATENGLTARIVERLGGDTLNALGTPNEIEARLLDLWIVNEALTRTDVDLPTERIQSLVDSFHWESYRNFLARGMTSDELEQLQSRIRDRYTEYGQALPPVSQGGAQSPLAFARVVTQHLFTAGVPDLAVALTVSGSATAALFAMVDALNDVLPRTDFS